MNEDASKLDLLILSYCLRGYTRLHQLLRHDVDLLKNMPHHGLDRTSFILRIRTLLERDWLYMRFDPTGWLRPGQELALKASGWIAPSDPPDDIILRGAAAVQKLTEVESGSSVLEWQVSFGLTGQGGRRWEKFATPAWPLYVEEGTPAVINDRVFLEFRGTSQRTMSLFAKMLNYYGRMPSCGANLGRILYWNPDLILWKQFHSGHRLFVDTGEERSSHRGQLYLRGGFSSGLSSEDRLCQLIVYFLSAWDLEFHLRLREMSRRIPEGLRTVIKAGCDCNATATPPSAAGS